MPNLEPEWRRHWPAFTQALQERLADGHREYGDESFSRTPLDLLSEIEQEVYDICGWAFILLTRLERLRTRMLELEKP